jgi:hypothetical protein
MVLNATFNNISTILWRSVLSVGKVLTIDDLDTNSKTKQLKDAHLCICNNNYILLKLI